MEFLLLSAEALGVGFIRRPQAWSVGLAMYQGILATPLHIMLLGASSALCTIAAVHAYKWLRLRNLAAFIRAQPVKKLKDAVEELRRCHAAGTPGKILGVFEGFVACNHAPPLVPLFRKGLVMHSLQILRKRIGWWGDVDSLKLVDRTSQVRPI